MLIVFVCTGNICRSPMAEAIARARHGSPGIEFMSAGTLGLGDRPMTAEAAAVLAEAGIHAGGHSSRPLDAGLVAAADRIYVMEAAHGRWIITRWPDDAGTVELLDPDGTEVDDPFGRPLPAYRVARDHIGAALAVRAAEWTTQR